VRILVAIPRTILTYLAGGVMTLICGPLAIIVGRRNPSSPFIEKLIFLWSKTWLVAAGCPLEVQGRENVERGRSYVVVANHLSNLDVMACFLAVPVPIRYLAKRELFKVPILAPAMRAVGIVEVDREARSAVHEQVNLQSKQVIDRGHSIIIYPEGTRSREGVLRPFKKGAFTIAIASGLPVVPVTLHGTYQAWPPAKRLVYGGKISVVIDPPIPTEGLTISDGSTILRQAQEIISGRLRQLSPPGEGSAAGAGEGGAR